MTPKKIAPDDPKDDRYYVRLYNPRGGQYRKVIRGKRNAERHEAEMRAKLAETHGIDFAMGKKTLAQQIDDVLDLKDVRANSEKVYRNARKHIVDELGTVELRRLRYSRLVAFLERVERTSGPGMRASVEVLLRSALRTAARDEPSIRDPFAGVRHERTKGGRRPFAPEMPDVIRIRDHIRDKGRRAPAARAAMTLAVELLAGTGMRVGEACGLAVDDIDFLRKTITVRRQTLNPDGVHCYGPPKTTQSERVIPAPQWLLDSLAAYLARFPAQPVTLPWERPDGEPRTHALIVRGISAAGPMRTATIRDGLKRTGVTLRLPGEVTPHSLRHRYTSELHDAGVPQIVIDDITGHLPSGSISMTTYTKVTERGLSAAREAIEMAWNVAVNVPLRAVK